MNKQAYLTINEYTLPIDRNNYSIDYTDVETDRVTETGTTSREIVREGKKTINTACTVTQEWYARLRSFKQAPTLTVSLYDPGTGTAATATMWISRFTASLVADRSDKPIFAITMTLEEY